MGAWREWTVLNHSPAIDSVIMNLIDHDQSRSVQSQQISPTQDKLLCDFYHNNIIVCIMYNVCGAFIATLIRIHSLKIDDHKLAARACALYNILMASLCQHVHVINK